MTRIDDASERVPIRVHVPWDMQEHGRVALRRRKFGPIGTFLMRIFRMKTELTLNLDPIGSAVWLLIDGQRNAGQILDEMKTQFPDEPDLGRRLGQYLSTLASQQFVRLR